MKQKRSRGAIVDDTSRGERVITILKPWLELFDLTLHQLHVEFVDTFPEPAPNGGARAAEVTVGSPYKKITLRAARSQVDTCSTEELAVILVHELIHVILWPYTFFLEGLLSQQMVSQIWNIEEGITDTLANAFIKITGKPLITTSGVTNGD